LSNRPIIKHSRQPERIRFLKSNSLDRVMPKDGRIVENWHLEDNPTLLKQLGAIKP
jgi:hypothetical protein